MTKKELLNTLESLDDGIHQVSENGYRLYQGIVKDNKVLFYVTSMGTVFQDDGLDDELNQKFKEIGDLTSPHEFEIIARFNKWI